MCGIAGVYIKDPTAVQDHSGLERFLDFLFVGIEKRGPQASGYVAVTGSGRVQMDKAPINASEFIKSRERLPVDTRIILAHTRWATKGSTENYLNNHPVIHGVCFTTHNGTVKNDDELFKEYEIERKAEVDTEIIPAIANKLDFDENKMAEAFSKMEGSIACATISPVKYPRRVMLARTYSSPLVIINTKKFILWASTEKALKDAWAAVIGTPPSTKQFKDVAIRTMFVIEGDEMREVDIPYVHRAVPTPRTHNYQGSYTPREGLTRRPNVVELPRNPVPAEERGGKSVLDDYDMSVDPIELKAAVIALRAEGKGRARLWVDRDKHFPGGAEARIGMRWDFCGGCSASVFHADFLRTLAGERCLDCSSTRIELYKKRAAEATVAEACETKADSAEWKIPFPLTKIYAFNVWAEDDDFMHTEVLEHLSKVTGMYPEAVEFLIFRADPDKVLDVPGLYNLRSDLQDTYNELYAQYWEFYEADGMDKYVEILRTRRLALPAPESDSGVENVEDAEFTDVAPTSDLPKRTSVKTEDGCCSACNRKAKRYIVRTLTSEVIGYCNKHFQRCAEPKCKNHPNHTSHDGTRWCHHHARGKEQTYADTMLEQQGFNIGIGASDGLLGRP